MDNLNLVGPFLGKQQPIYPHLTQVLRVTAATVPGPAGVAQVAGSSFPGPTLYVAFTQQLRDDGSILPRDREPCLADDVAGRGLTAGYYLARLASAFNGLPVYVCIAPTSAPATTNNFSNTTNNFNNSIDNYTNTVNTYTNTVENYNSVYVNISNTTFNFGITNNRFAAPPGVFSKPTQSVTGAPGWIPVAGTFPMVWGAYDHIDWEWDGRLSAPGASSSVPGGTGWVPFLSVGRTPVNDTNYTANTTDRTIAFTALSGPRTVTLPPAGSMPAGFKMVILDESGSASAVNTLSFGSSGTDTVNGSALAVTSVNVARGSAEAVSNGVSTWTVTPPASATSPTSTNGQSILLGDYTCTTTLANTGLSITVPSAGTYLVWCVAEGTVVTAGSNRIQFHDGTTTVGPVALTCANVNSYAGVIYTEGAITTLWYPTVALTLNLQAMYGGGATAGAIKGTNSIMGYTKLA